MELHGPQPCNWPTAPAASSLVLMSVSPSRGALKEWVTADQLTCVVIAQHKSPHFQVLQPIFGNMTHIIAVNLYG